MIMFSMQDALFQLLSDSGLMLKHCRHARPDWWWIDRGLSCRQPQAVWCALALPVPSVPSIKEYYFSAALCAFTLVHR